MTDMKTRDPERIVPEKLNVYSSGIDACRSVKGWREDDLANWVATHRREVKRIVCGSSKHKKADYCSAA